MEPPVLTEGEKACLQEWAEDLDVEAMMLIMSPENDPQAAWKLGLEMPICVPELLPPAATQMQNAQFRR